MESLAQGPAAEEHGPRLPRTLELGWHVGAHPSRTIHGGARAGRPGAEPDSSHYQLADSQRLAKRGAWLDPSGYDAGKKIKGRKRHILVDTLGLLLNVVVHPADVQDRDGALHLLRRARRLFPFIELIFADGGYAGPKMALTVWRTGVWRLQIVKRSDTAGLRFCQNAGSSSGRSHGSAATDAWRATSSAMPAPLLPSPVSP